MIGRRSVLLGLAALPIAGAAGAAQRPDPRAALATLRQRLGPGGRLGVSAWDGEAGRISLDPDSRYAMCSTFKMPLAAAMLAAADRGRWAMTDELAVAEADLLEYAPRVRAALPHGRMTIEALCAAAVEVSDNSAANILLRRLGGPEALTAYLRTLGDNATRLDRIEPALNANLPDDPRDTTTPAAMMRLTRTLLFEERLARASRLRLANWMLRATTGRERIRAGVPAGWRVGDKTGTGANGAHNDVAFILPPQGRPIVIASFISGGDASEAVRNEIHGAVARLVTTGSP
jgi:beta-lactamase class A